MFRFDAPSFASAWQQARVRVIETVIGDAAHGVEESLLLGKVRAEDRVRVLELIFSESRKTGETLSIAAYRPLSVEEITHVLSHSGVPCFEGKWKRENHVFSNYLFRGTCPANPILFCCDYWREAGRGAVLGMNLDSRLSRHRSIGHGDEGCLDYVHLSPMIHRDLGVVPAFIRQTLAPLLARMAQEGCKITLEGFSENQLYCKVERDGSHDDADVMEQASIQTLLRELTQRVPQATIIEVRKPK